MKKQKIEDIFSSIENFSSVPPPELWSKIEEELDKPKKKKTVVLWWSAAACLLLGLLIPSVLRLDSDSVIETINNGSIEKSVVLDENKTISTEENNIGIKTDVVENSSIENTVNQLNNSKNNNTHKKVITHTDSDTNINSGIYVPKSNNTTENTNQAVAEKTFVTGKQNSFNSLSNNQTVQPKKRKENQVIAEKPFVAGKQNPFNSPSDNQNLQTEKRNENQTVAEKTFVTGKQNSFNPSSDNQTLQTEKRNENQTVAEKTFVTGKQNSFNPSSDNQLPNSIFEDKLASKNNAAITLNLNSDNKQKIRKELTVEPITTEKAILSENVQKTNYIANNNSLSKQDSVQLAELQNLEKGIAEIKTEKDKETKSVSNSEKWSLGVFAGIANSENYNNQKTFGNVNESKQTSTYGVKTNLKLNKKWAVSSGLKINELGQSIANVSYYKTYNTESFPSSSNYLSPNTTASSPKITNSPSYVFVSKNTLTALKSESFESGNIDQSLKYIEMPLEVSYAVFNKNKASISLNTGGFVGKLISNDVTLNGNSIGDNLNANDFVYGSLLSSTFQYLLYKKTHVFVEPGMNYYINPLNNQTFNQFQWSFNFGLNVSF
ncbi:hypothetical protein ACEN2I_11345 [Flavobacterium sp. W22_SRS_FK3]|uniref:hypothetical protein n=1 Tax=Flavobacterium sp. W22_SRS_FK3 TaxID=3240275 RepID=UPI003F9140E8